MVGLYVSTHFATGAALGKIAGSNWLALILGLFSHILLDVLPHHDYRGRRGIILDSVVALAMLLWLLSTPSYIIWGAAAGALPDLEVIINRLFFKGGGRRFFPSHSGILPHPSRKWPEGFILQASIMAGALVFLLGTVRSIAG